jgi:hypothetical protein
MPSKGLGRCLHADWITSQLDQFIADYGKLKAEDDKLAAEIDTLAKAIDEHTKDNRDTRKALQERRSSLAKQTEFLGKSVQEGQAAISGFHQSIEVNLALANHAGTWEWKETTTAP